MHFTMGQTTMVNALQVVRNTPNEKFIAKYCKHIDVSKSTQNNLFFYIIFPYYLRKSNAIRT